MEISPFDDFHAIRPDECDVMGQVVVLNGIPGIETRLPLFFSATQTDGRLSLNQFVDITTTTPAKLYRLYPRKGIIAVRSD